MTAAALLARNKTRLIGRPVDLFLRHCLIRIIHEWTVFLAKVRIQGNWPSQTASLPPRPPMQGAGYGPPPHRHRKHGIGGGGQRRNVLSAITLQRQAELPAIPPR